MKKRNILDTLVKVGVAAAAIGGTLYLLKDKLEEDPACKEAMDKVKEKIKQIVPEKETPADEEDFFDEDFDEIIHTSGSDRGYVTIKLSNDEEDLPEEAMVEPVEENSVTE